MEGLTEAYAAALKAMKDEEQALSLGLIVPSGPEMADARRRLKMYPQQVEQIRQLMGKGQLPTSAFEIAEDKLALLLAPAPVPNDP